jgi:hypothetical protein
MRDWPEYRSLRRLRDRLGSYGLARQWLRIFDRAYGEAASNPHCSYWDFQWTYCCWKHDALNIIPDRNLISNIGYGDAGTHSVNADDPLANLPAIAMSFPLRHPKIMKPNREADRALARTVYGYYPFPTRIVRKIKRLLLQRTAVNRQATKKHGNSSGK